MNFGPKCSPEVQNVPPPLAAVAAAFRDSAQVVGSIDSALLMWEACCVPSLLAGAGTWVGISPAAERKLESLQHWFLRLMLRVGPGCPVASLRWETGMLSMQMRIWVEKVMMVRHLRGLEEGSLARLVYDEQKEQGWPGLAKETSNICLELGIENCNESDIWSLSTKQYRQLLIQKCKEKDEIGLRKMAEGKIKCTKIMSELYGRKLYMSTYRLYMARQIFCTRVQMQPFGTNYRHDKRFKKSNFMCKCAKSEESESHLISGKCAIYGDLRKKHEDIEDDRKLTDFFLAILDRRERLEEKDTRTQDTLVAGSSPLLAARHSGVPPVLAL